MGLSHADPDAQGTLFAAFEQRLELGEIVLQGGGVVADVAQHVGLDADPLPAAVEIHPGGRVDQSADQGGILDAQDVQGRQDRAQVLGLGRALQVHPPEDILLLFPERRELILSDIEV